MSKEILQEFEYLLKAKLSEEQKSNYKAYFAQIKKDLGSEYLDNIDDKVERWIKITHYDFFHDSKPVQFYIQAKMLYRDGFYDAAIVVGRSICEMFCFDYLSSVPNPYNGLKEIEKTNFRELINYMVIPKEMPGDFFDKFINALTAQEVGYLKRFFSIVDDKIIFLETKKKEHLTKIITYLKKCFAADYWFQYDMLNSVYDIGNDYVHPKANNNSKIDSEIILNKIGQVLFATYGIHSTNQLIGNVVKTAYADYPDICKCNHLLITVFPSVEEAIKE